MISVTRLGGQVVILCVCVAIVLSGCSGGGGGDDGGGVILMITADGGAILWENTGGMPTLPSPCPTGVAINAAITFTFSGPVSPSSIPLSGIALGSINIFTTATSMPAQGTFTIEDDPAFPAGNQQRVVFRPFLPTSAAVPCAAGLLAASGYQITVPQGGNSPQVLVVAGVPITNAAITCFDTCGCPNPGTCPSRFTDPAMGPPFVASTTPPTGDPAPAPPTSPCSIVGNTVQVLVSEALNPAGIDLTSVRLVDAATGGQVPGSLVFHQAGTLPSLVTMARIDYVASQPLVPSRTYQLLFTSAVIDFVGNPIQTTQSNPSALLLFQTASAPASPQPPIVETFDTTQNLGSVTGALRWAGDGVLQATFPTDLVGTGLDGAFNPPAGATTVLDTNENVGGQSRQGIWNFTDVNIPATATVRIIGPYLAHLRCTGSFTLNGTVNVNAGTVNPSTPGAFSYELGPETGAQNNGAPGTNCEALGGVANGGGGAGGTGSGLTPPAGSPSTFQCATRAQTGESGFGPTLNGQPNPGPTNPLYAGGHGGDSGCFPAVGAGCTTGDLGGLGGAGGTAGRMGEPGVPRVSTVACSPTPSVVQPVAQPSPIAVAMIPPITLQSAGSGGGGGGDHLDPTGTPPTNDDQGGGGGGGGGGLRISSIGPYSQTGGGTILAVGAMGASAVAFAGAGGSGSGGEVWIQTFSTVTISSDSVINVDGPVRVGPAPGLIGCSNQASGGGGDGLVQVEAGQGPLATPSFLLLPTPTPTNGAVFSAPPFSFATAVTGQAISDPFFAGQGADYTGAAAVFNIGTAPGTTLGIRFEGAHEAINSTPANPTLDPSTTKTMASGGGPITAANLDELDGHAFIWFVVDVSYAPPPMTSASHVLPSVDSITISYSLPSPCP